MSQYTPFAGTSGNRATATLPNSPGKNTKDQGEPKRRQQLLFVNLLFWVWFKKWGPKSGATILVLFFAGTTAQFIQWIYKILIFWRFFRMDMTPFCHPVEAAWEWHGNQLKDVPKNTRGLAAASASVSVELESQEPNGQHPSPSSFRRSRPNLGIALPSSPETAGRKGRLIGMPLAVSDFKTGTLNIFKPPTSRLQCRANSSKWRKAILLTHPEFQLAVENPQFFKDYSGSSSWIENREHVCLP